MTIEPAAPFILADIACEVSRRPYLQANRSDISLVADPRFQYGTDTVEAIRKVMNQYLHREVTYNLKEALRAQLHDAILDGYRHGDVRRPVKDHPGAFKPHWPHNCEDCIYLGMGAPRDGMPVDLYFCTHSLVEGSKAVVVRYGDNPAQYAAYRPIQEIRKMDVNVWLACLLAEEEYLL